jgi:hypothetical protein
MTQIVGEKSQDRHQHRMLSVVWVSLAPPKRVRLGRSYPAIADLIDNSIAGGCPHSGGFQVCGVAHHVILDLDAVAAVHVMLGASGLIDDFGAETGRDSNVASPANNNWCHRNQEHAGERLRAGRGQETGGIAAGQLAHISGQRRGHEAGNIGDGADEGHGDREGADLEISCRRLPKQRDASPRSREGKNQGRESLKADKAKTLDEINKGENGFLVGDLYPFCFNLSDALLVAVGNPNVRGLLGKDARTFKDPTGDVYGPRLYDAAKEGQVNEVSYMSPKAGADKTWVPKVSLVTAVAGLGCGVGYYK